MRTFYVKTKTRDKAVTVYADVVSSYGCNNTIEFLERRLDSSLVVAIFNSADVIDITSDAQVNMEASSTSRFVSVEDFKKLENYLDSVTERQDKRLEEIAHMINKVGVPKAKKKLVRPKTKKKI